MKPAAILSAAFALSCLLPLSPSEAESSADDWTAPAAVSSLRRATVLVEDIDGVLPFYRDMLGLDVRYDQVVTDPAQLRLIGIPAARARVVALESPNDVAGGTVGLVQILDSSTSVDFSGTNPVALLFLSDDAHGLHGRLVEAGIQTLSDVETYVESRGKTYAFTVEDPAGTRISIAEIVGESR